MLCGRASVTCSYCVCKFSAERLKGLLMYSEWALDGLGEGSEGAYRGMLEGISPIDCNEFCRGEYPSISSKVGVLEARCRCWLWLFILVVVMDVLTSSESCARRIERRSRALLRCRRVRCILSTGMEEFPMFVCDASKVVFVNVFLTAVVGVAEAFAGEQELEEDKEAR